MVDGEEFERNLGLIRGNHGEFGGFCEERESGKLGFTLGKKMEDEEMRIIGDFCYFSVW